MRSIRPLLTRLWADERGISSVEYAMLLSIIGGAIILGAIMLGSAVSNELFEAAGWIGNDGIVDCGNSGAGDGTGGDGGTGEGGGNTC